MDGIKQMPGDKAIEYAYEKIIKDDIIACLESCEIPNKEAKALLKLKEPLDGLYREWLHNDYSHMDMIRDTINDLAQKEIRTQNRDVR